jgi:hypothetical protein
MVSSMRNAPVSASFCAAGGQLEMGSAGASLLGGVDLHSMTLR